MIYLFDGNEVYLIKKEIEKIFAEHDIDKTAVVRMDGNARNFDIDTLLEELETLPFLVEKKAIILRDPPFLKPRRKKGEKDEERIDKNENDKTIKKIERYFDDPLSEVDFIMYSETKEYSSTDPLLKKYKDKIVHKTCRSDGDLGIKVASILKDYGLVLTQKDRELLVSYAAGSLTKLIANVEVLSLYPDPIDQDVIKKICDRSIEDAIFDLSNAIFAKDISKAIMVTRDFKALGSSVFYLIAFLASQLRFYNEIQYYDKKGFGTQEMMKRTASKEFRIRLTLDTLHRYRDTDFLDILDRLGTLEQTLKSNSGLDDYERFELFIVDLMEEYHASDQRHL